MATQKEERPLRICDVCGGIDDHPRHVVAFAAGDAPAPNADALRAAVSHKGLTEDQRLAMVNDINDTTLQSRHMDCCRAAGCPTGDCNSLPDVRGAELLKFIQKGK